MIKITGTTHTAPDNLLVIQGESHGREVAVGPFDYRELLAALVAEPDESDYAEVLAENASLGAKLSKALRERDEALEALRDAAEAPEDAAEEPREDQDQIDRSWALERAAEVLGRLAAVGALPKDWAGGPVVHVAEWILGGKPVDRG